MDTMKKLVRALRRVRPELSILNEGYVKVASKTVSFLHKGRNVTLVFVIEKTVDEKKPLANVRVYGYDENDVSTRFYFYSPENNFLGGKYYKTLREWDRQGNDQDKLFLKEIACLEIIADFTREQFDFLQSLKLRRCS